MLSSALQWTKKNYRPISRTAAVILFYVVGMEYYHAVEKWPRRDCIYFITVSISTVGYGFYVPSNDHARIFTSFYVLFGIIFILSMADEFSRYVLVNLQDKIITCIDATEDRYKRAYSKVVMSLILITISVVLGTSFFAVNENWTAAQAFYWTISTVTTIGYGDLDMKHESSRIFCIFYITYNVLAFYTAVSNLKEVWWELHKRDDMRASVHGLDDANVPENVEYSSVQSPTAVLLLRKMSAWLFSSATAATTTTSLPASPIRRRGGSGGSESRDGEGYRGDDDMNIHVVPPVDASAFIIQALVASGKADQKTDIDPILRYLSERGLLLLPPQGPSMITRSEVSRYLSSRAALSNDGRIIRDEDYNSSHSHESHDKAPLRARRLEDDGVSPLSSSSSTTGITNNPLRQSVAVLQKFLRAPPSSSSSMRGGAPVREGGGGMGTGIGGGIQQGMGIGLVSSNAYTAAGDRQPLSTNIEVGRTAAAKLSSSSSRAQTQAAIAATSEDDLDFATV